MELLGFTSEHVNHILNGFYTKDGDISRYVDQNSLILITKDSDFRNSHILVGSPKKMIKVNLGNISNDRLIDFFDANIQSIQRIEMESDVFLIEMNQDGLLTVSR